MSEIAESASQETQSVVDEGATSFAVDSTPEVREGESSPAKNEPEKKVEEPQKEETSEKDGEKGKETKITEDILPKGVQKRIDAITKKRYDAQREADTLREENTSLRKAAEEKEEAIEAAKKPNLDDFDDDESYQDAMVDYKVKQALTAKDNDQKEASQKEREQRQKWDAEDRHARLQEGLARVAGKYDDFDKVISKVKVTPAMEDVITELPNAGEVAYFLGKDLPLVDEIAEMSPIHAAFKLKEISDSLKTKKTTKSPAPLRTVPGTGGDIKTLENLSMAEYNKVRDQQDKERRGGYI